MAEAGWYPDPQDPAALQFFDGVNWTGERRPAPGQATADTAQALPWQAQGQPEQAWQQSPQQASPEQGWQQPTQQTPQEQGWQQSPQEQGWQQSPQEQGWQHGTAAPGGQGPWQLQQPGAPRRRRRKPALLAAAAVVILAAAGLVTWLVWPSSSPSITYQGKEIKSASDVLKTTETNLAKVVKQRHGARNGDTRCYFAQQKKPPSGTKKTDVDRSLRCGPVLFVDGTKSDEYLSVPLSGKESGGKFELQAQKSLDGLTPQAVPSSLKLVRPDGKTAPAGSGGLSVPKPPPAEANVLTTASLGPVSDPPSLDNAVMVGKTSKVTIEAAGEVSRYGQGDDARSAPKGQKLIAFQLTTGAGDVSGGGTARPQLVVDNGTPRDIPDASGDDWVIAALPETGKALVQLVDSGFTQTLSLPAGTPGSDNIAVLTRTNRTAFVVKNFTVPLRVSQGSQSKGTTAHATVSVASLNFWIPRHESVHASSPRRAILSMSLLFTDADLHPGTKYGFDPKLLTMRLANGDVVHAKNVASGDRVLDVFDVPADFTKGRVQISGAVSQDGFKISVVRTKAFEISIPAN